MVIKFDGEYADYGEGFEKTGNSRRKFKGSEKSTGSQKNREGDRASKRVSHRSSGAAKQRTEREIESHFIQLTKTAQKIWKPLLSKVDRQAEFWKEIEEGHRPTKFEATKASERAFITAAKYSKFFLQNHSGLNIKNLGALMKGFGACSYDYDASDPRQSTEVRAFLHELERVLPGINEVDSHSLSHIIYSLSNLDNSDIPKSLVTELAKKVEESPDNWSLLDVSMALFGIKTIADDEVQDIFNMIVSKLTHQSKLDIDAAGLIKAIKDRPPALIKDLSDKLQQLLTQSVFNQMSEKDLANTADAIAGLPESACPELFQRVWSQWQRVESPAILASMLHSFTKYNDNTSCQYVKEIANKISEAEKNFTTIDIARCFIGLKAKTFSGMDAFIIDLTQALKKVAHQLDPKRFGQILNACLSFCPKSYAELYQVLADALSSGLKISIPSIVSSAMLGLLKKDPAMVEPLLQELEKQLDQNINSMGLVEISDIFYALTYNTSATATSIRSKLKTRLETVVNANLGMSPAEVYKALSKICYGARFDDRHLAVATSVLSTMLQSDQELPTEAITYAAIVSGLRLNPSKHSALLDILEQNPLNNKDDQALLLRELVLLQFAGKGKIACEEKLSSLICKLQEGLDNEIDTPNISGSSFEAMVFADLTRLQPNLNFSATKYVDGFEMDIYLPDLKINLEVDGPYHKLELVKKDNQMRDDYLQETYGIETYRVALDSEGKMTAKEVALQMEKHLQTRLRRSQA
ncbi:MAG: hypothetical protein HOA17_04655 [Candidatus Melainabacteria bacterium]|jgi:very-short-patch-repair endonuclease|nr:hypothetical protein [Candidatus Melainabacteria bacterium]